MVATFMLMPVGQDHLPTETCECLLVIYLVQCAIISVSGGKHAGTSGGKHAKHHTLHVRCAFIHHLMLTTGNLIH